MTVFVTCKNEEDLNKTEGARVPTTLYIDFPDAQGQLTPLSGVRSGRNSNSSELSWLSFLHARTKKIRSKIKAQMCYLYINKTVHRFFRRSKAANFAVSGGIPTKFELIQALMVVFVICNEEDPIKIEGARVLTTFLPL